MNPIFLLIFPLIRAAVQVVPELSSWTSDLGDIDDMTVSEAQLKEDESVIELELKRSKYVEHLIGESNSEAGQYERLSSDTSSEVNHDDIAIIDSQNDSYPADWIPLTAIQVNTDVVAGQEAEVKNESDDDKGQTVPTLTTHEVRRILEEPYEDTSILNYLSILTICFLVIALILCFVYIYYLQKYTHSVTQLMVDEVKSYDGQYIVLLVPTSSKPPPPQRSITMTPFVEVKTLERY